MNSVPDRGSVGRYWALNSCSSGYGKRSTFIWSGEVGIEPPFPVWNNGCITLMLSPLAGPLSQEGVIYTVHSPRRNPVRRDYQKGEDLTDVSRFGGFRTKRKITGVCQNQEHFVAVRGFCWGPASG